MNVNTITVHIKKIFTKVSPIQALVLGYVVIILAGSLVLRLPGSSSTGESQEFIDALFTATSAVSTTGLVVVDTGTYYSLFGQVILLFLFQIGGLGYMAFVVLMIYALGRKLSLVSAVTLKESLSGVTLGNMKKYLKAVFAFTLLFEGAGAFLLAVYWLPHFSVSRSVYLGIFHSVSAFCTSGFSLFPNSFSSYQTDGFIHLVLCTLSIAGGVGFIVLTDITAYIQKRMRKVRPYHVSIHTKLAILVSILLMGTGTGVIFLSEGNLPLQSRVYTSVFQSVSASSTTGFNTTDIGVLSTTSLFMIIILMFIGASPGGSGGGIKGTAFGLTVLAVWAVLKGTEDVNVFHRRILPDTIWKSFSIALLAALWVAAVTMVLTVTEGQSFLAVLFEVVSAIGTVGLSTGITAGLTSTGKFLIIVTMLIGRVGPLAIAFSLMGEPETVSFKYAEEEVFIG